MLFEFQYSKIEDTSNTHFPHTNRTTTISTQTIPLPTAKTGILTQQTPRPTNNNTIDHKKRSSQRPWTIHSFRATMRPWKNYVYVTPPVRKTTADSTWTTDRNVRFHRRCKFIDGQEW